MSTALRSRFVAFDRAQLDEAGRTISASLSSETPVRRAGGVIEVLRHDVASIDLSRAKGGLPLLIGHDRAALPVGVIESVRLEGRRLVGQLRFSRSARGEEVFRDVKDGVLQNVSIAYSVEAEEPLDGGYAATRWTPHEGSIVSVPADHTVGIGRSATTQPTSHIGTPVMTQATIIPTADRAAPDAAAEVRQRDAIEILTSTRHHGLPDSFGQALIERALDVDRARHAILEELARRDQGTGGHLNVSGGRYAESGATLLRQCELMADALAARIGGTPLKSENPYRHARVADMARDCLELRGVRTTGLSRSTLVERALHTTSDFPDLLQGAGARVLRTTYTSYAGGLKRICKPSTAADFRAKQRLMLGEAPELLRVNEHGEFKYGTMAETKGSYSLGTFGRIFGITRQALVNDDLDAFGDMAGRLGRAAAEFESSFLVTLLTSNPTMSEDNLALFHASHNNLATGGGSVLAVSALSTARKNLRLQKGLNGTTPIDATPSYLIVPAALETTAEQLISSIMPSTTGEVNPFAGKLELVVDPRLDAVSTSAWYLAASPNLVDTIEYSYLESAGGPEVFVQEGFEIDGVQMKVRLDFGAGVLDWRGLYKSAGI